MPGLVLVQAKSAGTPATQRHFLDFSFALGGCAAAQVAANGRRRCGNSADGDPNRSCHPRSFDKLGVPRLGT